MTLTSRFDLLNGKHFYADVSQDKFSQLMEANKQSKHAFLVAGDKKFEYTGDDDMKMHTFREVELIEIKALRFIHKLDKKNQKLANTLREVWQKEKDEKGAIENLIKEIGVKRTDPLILKIQELKKQPFSAKNQAKIKVLWWEAKRKAFREQVQKANVNKSVMESEDSLTGKVLDTLRKRIIDAIKDYQAFPKEASIKFAALNQEQKEDLIAEFDKQFGQNTAPGWGELKGWLESRYIQDKFPGEDYDSLRGYVYKHRVENNYPISTQEKKVNELMPTAEDYARRDRILEEEKRQASEYWSSRRAELVERFTAVIMRILRQDENKLKNALKMYSPGKIMEQIHRNRKNVVEGPLLSMKERGEQIPTLEQIKDAFSEAAKSAKKQLGQMK